MWYRIVTWTKMVTAAKNAQEGTNLVLEHTEVAVELPDRGSEDCRAVSSVLARVGDKWSILIIVRLGDGPKRFNEIKRMVGGISQRMLTLTLRGLERDGLVKRTQFQTIPPRVDYELTQLGRSLWDAVEPLGAWARAHVKQIARAQAVFDKRINAWSRDLDYARINPRDRALRSSSAPIRRRECRSGNGKCRQP
jgi:DNA-binding HxlR family transcriptional regulator